LPNGKKAFFFNFRGRASSVISRVVGLVQVVPRTSISASSRLCFARALNNSTVSTLKDIKTKPPTPPPMIATVVADGPSVVVAPDCWRTANISMTRSISYQSSEVE